LTKIPALGRCPGPIVQEGLSNAHRHARGAGQHVELRGGGDRIHLWVADEGPGFSPPPPGEWGEHMGLAGMRERVESLGGESAILSQTGDGTRVFASLPLQVTQDAPV
jgi:signal transduction histidine kinase